MVWIIILFIAAIIIWGWFKYQQELQEMGIPKSAISFWYEGGHPELEPSPSTYIWPGKNGLFIANTRKKIGIPKSDIIGIALNDNIQHVNVGGGRSISGAIIGGAIAGPAGAIVGSKKSTKVKEIDKSKTMLNIKYKNIQTQLMFDGGNSTYNKLASLLSEIQ